MIRVSALATVCVTFLVAFPDPSSAQDAEVPEVPEAQEEDPLVGEAERLEEKFERLLAQRKEFEAKIRGATGENLKVLEEQNWQRQMEVHATLHGLVDNLVRREKANQDASDQRARLQSVFRNGFKQYHGLVEFWQDRVESLRAGGNAEERDGFQREQAIANAERKLQAVFRVELEVIDMMQILEVDSTRAEELAAEDISNRASTLAGRIGLTKESLEELIARLEANPEDAETKSGIRLLEESLDRDTDNLSSTVALMSRLDLERAHYQQLLIETTGEVTPAVFDSEVAFGLLRSWRKSLVEEMRTRGPGWLLRFFMFVVILLVSRTIAVLMRRIVSRGARSSRFNSSQLLQDTLVSWSARIVMMVGFLIALSQLGIEIGALLAGLGIAGFVLGFALQDSLSNFAAGAMILIYRPFDVGDVVEAAGVSGTVNQMSLVSTTIMTFDNQTLIVPNTKIWGDVIRNVTAQKTRRVDLTFGVRYGDDIDHVERVIREVLAQHDSILADPPPTVEIHSLGESSVNFIVRPWANTVDYWRVYWDLTRQVKQRFDAEGISIPAPRREIHVRSNGLP